MHYHTWPIQLDGGHIMDFFNGQELGFTIFKFNLTMIARISFWYIPSRYQTTWCTCVQHSRCFQPASYVASIVVVSWQFFISAAKKNLPQILEKGYYRKSKPKALNLNCLVILKNLFSQIFPDYWKSSWPWWSAGMKLNYTVQFGSAKFFKPTLI
jgi:hypothetical protein